MASDITNTTHPKKLNKKEVAACQNICRHYGKKYYIATFFLRPKERYATWVLYSFFRVADEIVDTEELNSTDAHKKLLELKDRWSYIYENEKIHGSHQNDDILLLTKRVFTIYDIPVEYSISFFEAMLSDTLKKRYATYPELENYMYGSAAVVGLMMSQVIGCKPGGREAAILLGEAMQMTNFLRDIKEDLQLRDRIYLPKDGLSKHSIDESKINTYIKTDEVDDNFKEYMRQQILLNRAQYEKANQGIWQLAPRGRLGVYIASNLYEKILEKIEENEYNVFNKRVSPTKTEKIIITLSSIWNLKIKKSL